MDFPKSVPSVGLVDGKFIDEDAVAGTPGSLIPSAWGNAVTQEILKVIQEAGLEPDEDDNTQLNAAIDQKISETSVAFASQPEAEAGESTTKAMSPLRVFQAIAKVVTQATESAFGWLKISSQPQINAGLNDAVAVTPKKLAAATQGQVHTAFTAGGTATALTLTPVPPIDAYAASQRFTVKFPVNSGLNPTLNISAKGAKSFKQYDAAGAKVGAQFAADQVGDVLYDGVDFVLLDQLPSVKQGIRGAASNYKAFANGSSGNIAITADRVTLEDAAGNCVTVTNVNLTLNTLVAASATVSGMATGATMAGGGYGTYLWYNKTTGVLIATGDSSLSAPTSPAAGFDFWARRGSFRCDQSANRYPLRFAQFNNECEFQLLAGTNVISYPTIITGSYPTPTTVSLASILPATASFATFAAGTTSGYVGFAPVGSFTSTPGTGYLSPAQPNGFPFAAGYNASGPVPTCCGAISLNTLSVQYCGTGTPSILQCLGWRDNL